MIKANNYISDDVANILSCNIIPKQSIVFAKIGAAIALERKRITSCLCCIDNNMMSFQPYEKETAQFMCYLFQTVRFGELVEATALPSLSGKTIGEIKKIFPPTSEEQIAISSILSDIDNEIEALEKKLEKTRQVKQGMMQQLLTGKIRLL
jgi:type I restriction enzyme S subunit